MQSLEYNTFNYYFQKYFCASQATSLQIQWNALRSKLLPPILHNFALFYGLDNFYTFKQDQLLQDGDKELFKLFRSYCDGSLRLKDFEPFQQQSQ